MVIDYMGRMFAQHPRCDDNSRPKHLRLGNRIAVEFPVAILAYFAQDSRKMQTQACDQAWEHFPPQRLYTAQNQQRGLSRHLSAQVWGTASNVFSEHASHPSHNARAHA